MLQIIDRSIWQQAHFLAPRGEKTAVEWEVLLPDEALYQASNYV